MNINNVFDIIIPLKSTNTEIIANIEKLNLNQNVNEIHIGDAGINNEIKLKLQNFSKVKIHNHASIYSQGYSIAQLIDCVKTEYFVYLHGDVELPNNWFDTMYLGMSKYDFAECGRLHHYRYEYKDNTPLRRLDNDRPLSGAQMGRTEILKSALAKIEDDHLFRNEDIIIADQVKRIGARYGVINETYHIHQVGFDRINENISAELELKASRKITQKDEQLFIHQICGIVKYCEPLEEYHIWHFDYSIAVLKYLSNDLAEVKLLAQKKSAWKKILLTRKLRILKYRLSQIIRIIKMTEKDLLEI